jgi:putative holliday junction resolvase
MTREKSKRIIGIDYGLARIGVAISDELKIIASPLNTIACQKKLEDTVKIIIAEIERIQESKDCVIEEIIFGMPLRMNGNVGVQADEVKALAELLKSHIETPIVLWDERLTTVQAERSLREGKMTRKKRSKVIDNVAAAIILQSYLDHKKATL